MMPRNENDLLRWGDIVNALFNYHKSVPADRAFCMAEILAVLHELEFIESETNYGSHIREIQKRR